jgi:hypothetical protein
MSVLIAAIELNLFGSKLLSYSSSCKNLLISYELIKESLPKKDRVLSKSSMSAFINNESLGDNINVINSSPFWVKISLM